MTAVTVVEAYDNTLGSEGMLRMAYLDGESGSTYTPTNASGKTIRIMSCYTASGTALQATVSGGVITLGEKIVDGENFTIMYTAT